MDGYFSEEQQKAKNWDMVQERNALRAELARLKHESEQIGLAVQKYWAATLEPTSHSFSYRDNTVEVCRIVGEKVPGVAPARTVVATIPQSYFDVERSVQLQSEIKKCEAALGKIGEALKDLGV